MMLQYRPTLKTELGEIMPTERTAYTVPTLTFPLQFAPRSTRVLPDAAYAPRRN